MKTENTINIISEYNLEQIEFLKLSKKQKIGLLNNWVAWGNQFFSSFSEMLINTYYSSTKNENSPLFVNATNNSLTEINHGFYDLSESEESLFSNL